MDKNKGGRGMKRKRDGEALLFPAQETKERSNNESERRQGEETNDDVPMPDVPVATRTVHDDEAIKEKLNEIIERILNEHSDHRFLENWNVKKFALLDGVMCACEEYSNKDNFVNQLKGAFWSLFGKENDIMASFISKFYTRCLNARLIDEGTNFSDRVVPITHGLGQDFLGSFDSHELHKHVLTVFKWHEGDYKDYRSPSFAIIQSSGMGKTKLMREYARQKNNDASIDFQCRLILCMRPDQSLPPNFDEHYHEKLILKEYEKGFNDVAAAGIKEQLVAIEKKCTAKVVFFFDEAQMLLSEKAAGPYHTVLWWLRQNRSEEFQYVGVFAGTLLGLSKFQVVKESSQHSRDPKVSYKNYNDAQKDTEKQLQLYDPFYSLTTISLAHSRKKKDNTIDALQDIRKYGWNGRPLFAAMLQGQDNNLPALTLSDKNVCNGVIHNPTMYNILLRVLLSPNPNRWASSDYSIASVLGTRVQLGLANYDFVNNATSLGYAMLVRYDTPTSDNEGQMMNFGTVAIVFPPDPVCAALAMGLMQPGWVLKQNVDARSQIRGMEPKFWIQNMARLLDQHFFLPSRGDSGEVFAALYMLLCGDILRYNQDPYMRLFEINLENWLQEVKQEEPVHSEGAKRQKVGMDSTSKGVRRSPRFQRMNTQEGTGFHLTLNFIQVCRNYFRSHAWFGQAMLEYMYDTATGCYVYPHCPAIDIVFPIKEVKTECGTTSYHPCLVSVKCWDSIDFSDMVIALTSMEEYLKKYRKADDKSTSALCLLLVIGRSTTPEDSPHKSPEKLPVQKGSFPHEDTYITVVVPSTDRFEINKTIANMAGTSHVSELLASHSFAHAENNKSALRVTAKATYHELGQSLLADKKLVWSKS